MNKIWTDKYQEDVHKTEREGVEGGGGKGSRNDNYGMEKMEELTNCLHIPDKISPKHPNVVGMTPVEGDVTVMG